MSFFDRLFRAKASEPTDPGNELYQQLYDQLRKDIVHPINPKKVESYIKQGYMLNPHIYSTINVILREIKQLKWGIYEVVDEKSFRKGRTLKEAGQFTEGSLMQTKGLEAVEIPELNRILREPNECQSFVEFIEEAFGFYYATGNSYTYGLVPSGFKFFSKVYNMPAQFTKIVSNGWMEPVSKYHIDWTPDKSDAIDAALVYHYKKFNPNYTTSGNQLYGMSPMAPLCKVIDRSNESYSAGLALMKNGMPAGMLSMDPGAKPMGTEDQKKGERKMRDKFGGGKNANKIMLTTAPLKWQEMGLNAGKMQLLESNKADAEDIAKAYGVPLPLVNNDASSFNNLNTVKKTLWQNVIMPDLRGFTEGFGDWLLAYHREQTGKKLVLHFDTSTIPALQEDLNTLSKRLLEEMGHGLWTGNDVRQMLGRSTDEQSDHLNRYMLSSNLNFVDDDGQES